MISQWSIESVTILGPTLSDPFISVDYKKIFSRPSTIYKKCVKILYWAFDNQNTEFRRNPFSRWHLGQSEFLNPTFPIYERSHFLRTRATLIAGIGKSGVFGLSAFQRCRFGRRSVGPGSPWKPLVTPGR